MAWTAPRTWSNGEVPTASVMNAHVRDNLLALAPALVTTAGDLVKATGANALARVAIGTAGQQLGVSSGAPAWGSAEDPWWVDIDPFPGPETNSHWSTVTAVSAWTYAGYLASDGTQNAEATWTVLLAPGPWTCRIAATSQSSFGIITIQLDGSTVGTVDLYNVSGAELDVGPFDVTGVTVSGTRKKTLRLLMATKNASSSGYTGRVRRIIWIRTA